MFYGKRQEDSLTCRDALGTWTSKESGDSSVRWCVPVEGSVPTVVSSRILRRGGDYSLITPHLVVVDILLITTEPWCVANRDLRACVGSLRAAAPVYIGRLAQPLSYRTAGRLDHSLPGPVLYRPPAVWTTPSRAPSYRTAGRLDHSLPDPVL